MSSEITTSPVDTTSPGLPSGSKSDPVARNVGPSIKRLRADELVDLSKRKDTIFSSAEKSGYMGLIFSIVTQYIYFFFKTWAWTIWNFIDLPLATLDYFAMLWWANVSCILLFFIGLSCLFLRFPPFLTFFNNWSKKNANSMNVINAGNPKMFTSLSKEQVKAGIDGLAAPMASSPDKYTSRVFNLDISKILLLCAALMYERGSDKTTNLVQQVRKMSKGHIPPSTTTPTRRGTDPAPEDTAGSLLAGVVGEEGMKDIIDQMDTGDADTGVISGFAEHMGLKFLVASELNSIGSAFCGLFYDPNSTFIILAFKGTTAGEFTEWTTDVSFTASPAGDWVTGFGNVATGFYHKMFPPKITKGGRLPYDTIRRATLQVAGELLKGKPEGTQINLWFTGHSLGCAMASLAYARAIHEGENDLSESLRLRDCYIFAAPLMTDYRSVQSFNNQMNRIPDRVRTMWRVTGGRDFVATGLPAWGDVPDRRLSPYNLFGYAHLGTELTMKDPPKASQLAGNHILTGSDVELYSALGNAHGVVKDPNEKKNWLAIGFDIFSHVPLISRMVDHGTTMYWDRINALKVGPAEWTDN